jgi:hypothetical protein
LTIAQVSLIMPPRYSVGQSLGEAQCGSSGMRKMFMNNTLRAGALCAEDGAPPAI